MPWTIEFADEFEPEFDAFDVDVQNGILARLLLLERFGPALGRPHVDTLEGSRHANVKELRCTVGGGVWRVAFAFDTSRRAILLAGGNKSGKSERKFYRRLIALADTRFDQHLARMRTWQS